MLRLKARHQLSWRAVAIGFAVGAALFSGCTLPNNGSARAVPQFIPPDVSSLDPHSLARLDMGANTRVEGMKVLVDGTAVDGQVSTVFVRPGKHHVAFQHVHPGVPSGVAFNQAARDANGNLTSQTTGWIADPSSLGSDVVDSEKTEDVDLQAGQRYAVTAP